MFGNDYELYLNTLMGKRTYDEDGNKINGNEDNKMEKYEFHVGDYVETVSISKPAKKNKIEPLEALKPKIEKKMADVITVKAEDYPNKKGCAEAEKKLVNVIIGWEHPSNEEIVNKLNEVIAYINKQEE